MYMYKNYRRIALNMELDMHSLHISLWPDHTQYDALGCVQTNVNVRGMRGRERGQEHHMSTHQEQEDTNTRR